MGPIKIVRIAQTCLACPSQWDAWDAAGVYYYIRYRWGRLTVSRREDEHSESLYDERVGDALDGAMTTEQLRVHIREVLTIP